MGRSTIGLASSGLGRVWPDRDILVSSCTSDSCGGPGAVRANQVHGVSSDTLGRLASGLDACCVKKRCGLVGLCFGGRMAFDLGLSQAVAPEICLSLFWLLHDSICVIS